MHTVLTGTCNGLLKVPETQIRDRVSVGTGAKSLFVKEMQNVVVDLDGDVEGEFLIILDAYSLRAVPILPPVVPAGREEFSYRLDWKMLTEFRRTFTHEYYLLTQQSKYDRIFGQYANAHAWATRGLKFYINTYNRAPHFITTGSPLPSGFSVMELFIWRNYAGVTAEWRADQDSPGRSSANNPLRRFDRDLRWE